MSDVTAKKAAGWLPVALDYVPLLIFFATYKFTGDVFTGTAVFMVAIVAAIIIGKWQVGRVSPMTWLSAILVIGFGGLTLYMHDEKFIQIKPTIIYALLGGLLLAGVIRGKPFLKYVFEHGYNGLSERGWILLSRNWAVFFLAMAIFNEAVRATFDFGTWLTIKVWGMSILSGLFAVANLPMLMKHGLGAEDVAKPAE
ncbi:MAG: septation protein IspZ [Sphingomonadaceae bacterium]